MMVHMANRAAQGSARDTASPVMVAQKVPTTGRRCCWLSGNTGSARVAYVTTLLLVGAGIGHAQPPTPAPAVQITAVAPLLAPEQLDALLAPFAGAPQDLLGVVLDACRYPDDLLAAAQWARAPEAMRGAASGAWAPTVRLLAERAPRTLDYLAQDIARTSALGSAYQSQPNDVWLAYGRVTAERKALDTTAASRPAAEVLPAAPAPVAAPAPPPPAPASTVQAAPAAPPASGTTTVIVAPTPPQTSATGAAVVGGLIGFGAGLLVGELADNNNSYWGAPYAHPYAAPAPYAPYAGGGYRYDAARGLQDDRLTAASQMQQSHQTHATTQREDWQAYGTQQQQGRQEGTAERQATRQEGAQTQQAGRQESAAQRQQTTTANQGSRQASGQQRQQQTAEQQASRQGAAASGQRTAAAQSAGASSGTHRRNAAAGGSAGTNSATAISTPQRSTAARPSGAKSTPQWGPAAGMSDRTAASRSRNPSGGHAQGSGASARGGGRR